MTAPRTSAASPRLGFVGVGWIGRHRLESVVASELADVVAVADLNSEQREAARRVAPRAATMASLEELFELDLDGIVIASPSALHAEQSVAALERGLAVFCQKPLGRDAEETGAVVTAARRADRLLGVDFCYRHTEAMKRLRELASSGALGTIYAAELVFHNAYGPDKPWFYDRRSAGGGCLMDLGIHLVDLALWTLDSPRLSDLHARLYAGGRPLLPGEERVEDYATAQIGFGEKTVRIACSWNLPAGRDAIIEASFYGTGGGAALRNVDGSFYDFVAERYDGTRSQTLARPPDAWGGRAIVEWVRALGAGGKFDPEVERAVEVARIIDAVDAAGRERHW